MRRLYLLRHAKSDWPAGVQDHERPLAKRGLRDAPRVGKAMTERGYVPDLAIISTARRTRQTWELIKPELGPGVTERFERAIYEASPQAILDVIRTAPAEAKKLLVIGHNPGLELLAAALSGHCEQRGEMTKKFPTAALAAIEFDSDSWQDLAKGEGRLVVFLKPAELD